jgi:pyrimidine operon attenuation protein/uracil phosphoribosyltransferase
MESKKIIQEKEFDRILRRLSIQIVEKNLKNIEKLAFIGIKKRGVPLAERLKYYIQKFEGFDIPLGEYDISLYKDDQTQTTISHEPIVYGGTFNFSFSGKILVVVDDLLQSGRTARAAMESILDRSKPEAIQLCVMVDTRSRILPISADFYGVRLRVSKKKEYVKVNLKEFDGEDSIEIFKKS